MSQLGRPLLRIHSGWHVLACIWLEEELTTASASGVRTYAACRRFPCLRPHFGGATMTGFALKMSECCQWWFVVEETYRENPSNIFTENNVLYSFHPASPRCR